MVRSDPSHSTAELVELMRAGSHDASERIFTTHRAALEARARAHPLRRALWTRPDPADLVHDALLRALTSGFFERFEDRGAGSLRNALFRILDRTILDAIRRERADKRVPNGSVSEDDELRGGPAVPCEAMVDRREPTPTSGVRVDEWMERCRALLPEREWEVWSEVEIHGRTAAEVARGSDMSESSARGLLFRARERILRSLCDEEE